MIVYDFMYILKAKRLKGMEEGILQIVKIRAPSIKVWTCVWSIL